jgi:hypothetical protein
MEAADFSSRAPLSPAAWPSQQRITQNRPIHLIERGGLYGNDARAILTAEQRLRTHNETRAAAVAGWIDGG